MDSIETAAREIFERDKMPLEVVRDDPHQTAIDKGISEIAAIIRKHLSNSGWVKVTDRLPEGRGYYLVAQGGNRLVESCYRNTDGDWVGRNSILMGVTHWQPLPAPPTSDETK